MSTFLSDCLICGKQLLYRRSDAKYCSANCRKRAERYRKDVSRKIQDMFLTLGVMSRRAELLSGDGLDSLDALRIEIETFLKVNGAARRDPLCVTDK